jgi:hypothetical protein
MMMMSACRVTNDNTHEIRESQLTVSFREFKGAILSSDWKFWGKNRKVERSGFNLEFSLVS